MGLFDWLKGKKTQIIKDSRPSTVTTITSAPKPLTSAPPPKTPPPGGEPEFYQAITQTDITAPRLDGEPAEKTSSLASYSTIIGGMEDLSDAQVMTHISRTINAVTEATAKVEAPPPVKDEFQVEAERQREFAKLLLQSNLVSEDELTGFLEQSRDQLKEDFIGTLMIESGLLTESRLNYLLSKHYKIMNVDLHLYEVPSSVLDILPGDFARRHRVLPVDIVGKILTLATDNPFNFNMFTQVEKQSNKTVRPVYCQRKQLTEYLDIYYPPGAGAAGIDMTSGDYILVEMEEPATEEAPSGATSQVGAKPATSDLSPTVTPPQPIFTAMTVAGGGDFVSLPKTLFPPAETPAAAATHASISMTPASAPVTASATIPAGSPAPAIQGAPAAPVAAPIAPSYTPGAPETVSVAPQSSPAAPISTPNAPVISPPVPAGASASPVTPATASTLATPPVAPAIPSASAPVQAPIPAAPSVAASMTSAPAGAAPPSPPAPTAAVIPPMPATPPMPTSAPVDHAPSLPLTTAPSMTVETVFWQAPTSDFAYPQTQDAPAAAGLPQSPLPAVPAGASSAAIPAAFTDMPIQPPAKASSSNITPPMEVIPIMEEAAPMPAASLPTATTGTPPSGPIEIIVQDEEAAVAPGQAEPMLDLKPSLPPPAAAASSIDTTPVAAAPREAHELLAGDDDMIDLKPLPPSAPARPSSSLPPAAADFLSKMRQRPDLFQAPAARAIPVEANGAPEDAASAGGDAAIPGQPPPAGQGASAAPGKKVYRLVRAVRITDDNYERRQKMKSGVLFRGWASKYKGDRRVRAIIVTPEEFRAYFGREMPGK